MLAISRDSQAKHKSTGRARGFYLLLSFELALFE
jgi:hypothetical protein